MSDPAVAQKTKKRGQKAGTGRLVTFMPSPELPGKLHQRFSKMERSREVKKQAARQQAQQTQQSRREQALNKTRKNVIAVKFMVGARPCSSRSGQGMSGDLPLLLSMLQGLALQSAK